MQVPFRKAEEVRARLVTAKVELSSRRKRRKTFQIPSGLSWKRESRTRPAFSFCVGWL